VQKSHLASSGVAISESLSVESNTSAHLENIGRKFGYPYMLKSRTLAYDGRGNYVVSGPESISPALEALKDRPLYAEKWASFSKELAVMVVRRRDGVCISYPTVETIHEENICKLVYAPAAVSGAIQEKARKLAEKAVGSLWGAGVFGVEMFLLEDGKLSPAPVFGAKLVLTWGLQGNFSSTSSPLDHITRATTPSKHVPLRSMKPTFVLFLIYPSLPTQPR